MSAGHLIILAGGLAAIASTGGLLWYWRIRDRDVERRNALNRAAYWREIAGRLRERIDDLQNEVVRLAAENDQLRRAEVAHLPAKQTGDQS